MVPGSCANYQKKPANVEPTFDIVLNRIVSTNYGYSLTIHVVKREIR